jgi:hypothetical protein
MSSNPVPNDSNDCLPRSQLDKDVLSLLYPENTTRVVLLRVNASHPIDEREKHTNDERGSTLRWEMGYLSEQSKVELLSKIVFLGPKNNKNNKRKGSENRFTKLNNATVAA